MNDHREPPRPGNEDAKTNARSPEPPAAGHARFAGKPLLAEGSRFGVYIVGPCIGEGGMARIYRAEHEGLQRQVALKVLLDVHGRDTDGHERFLREARIAAAIKHPNVVNIFDVGVHQGRPYLVMELLEGMDLEAYVESQGSLDEATLMDVIIPIVAGLAAVHDAGIVHRDLKPGNIFLARGRNDELEPKLLDFGISKSSGHNQMKVTSSKGLLMGTPFYMSPEASQGHEMTPLSDQYALGVVLYECATGTNPFAQATTFGEVVRQVTTGTYAPVASKNPRLSKRMVAIIERAMHLDPSRRFPDMRAMGRELLTLAGQRTRITWGLSFNELAPGAALARAPGAAPSYMPRRDSGAPPNDRTRRLWPILGLGAGAAAIVAALAWPTLSSRESSLAVQSLTPPRTEVSVVGHDPGPSAPTPRPAEVQPPAALPIAQVPEQKPDEPEGVAKAARDQQDAPGDSTNDGSQARSRTEQARVARVVSVARESRRSRDVAPRRNVAPRRQAAPPRDDTPEWLVSSQQVAASEQRRGPDRGTNNAPILE